jgi:hypothetical protein
MCRSKVMSSPVRQYSSPLDHVANYYRTVGGGENRGCEAFGGRWMVKTAGSGRDFFVKAAHLDQRQLEPTCTAVTPSKAAEQGEARAVASVVRRGCRYRSPQRSRDETAGWAKGRSSDTAAARSDDEIFLCTYYNRQWVRAIVN